MSKVYLLGDIHGNFKPVRELYQTLDAKPAEEDTLVLLGDAGLNFFFNHRDAEVKRRLGKYGFTYFVIRGNHEQRPEICAMENPSAWHQEMYFDNYVWVETEFPYIKYAVDFPAVYNILGKSALVIPGAYSVDKYVRLQKGWSWFEGEQLTQTEMNIGSKLVEEYDYDFDIVLSHTCPISYEPTDLFLSVVDQSTVDKSMERYLEKIERQLKYRLWVFGHYHALRIYPPYSEKQMLMLYNDWALDLNDYWDNRSPYESLIDIK